MDEPSPRDASFAATRWTLVLRARGDTPEAKIALEELCAAYWQPVFRSLRREGRSEDAAQELTQAFFARLLAHAGMTGLEPGRGRFRSYLLGALKHFLADEADRAQAVRRGGGVVVEPLDAGTATSPGIEPAAPEADLPDAEFDRQWAYTVMQRALEAVAAEHAARGRAEQFEALRPWLGGEAVTLSLADAAARMGSTEGAAKVAIHRLRRQFRERVRAEIAQTVPKDDDVDEELRYLVDVLASGAG